MMKFAIKVTVCIVILVAAATIGHASSPTITVLHSFTSGCVGTDGCLPNAPLVQASDGDFYGTASGGGDDGNGCQTVCGGTIFRLTPQGQFTVLHTFVGTDGSLPLGGLVEGPDDYLYGTTSLGGTADIGAGSGTIYKIRKSGQFQKLHEFCNACPGGINPRGSLVLGRDGYIYGTTSTGTPSIFRISSAGAYSAVVALGSALGTTQFGLVQASDGNFYGAANSGVYRMTPAGQLTPLYFFAGSDGGGNSELIQAADGNLYGATYPGAVFKISLAGTFQKILTLDSSVQGINPNALLQAVDGNLWGTTKAGGGSGNVGTLYTISTGGAVLQTLSTSPSAQLQAPIIQGRDGKLYGTAHGAGGSDVGTVFVVDAGLPVPFTDFFLVATVSTIKAVHVMELRSRIDAQRIRFHLSPYAWTDQTLAVGATVVRVEHIIELRTALNEAYAAHGLTPVAPTFTDPVLSAGMVIKAVHVAELRSGVIVLEGL